MTFNLLNVTKDNHEALDKLLSIIKTVYGASVIVTICMDCQTCVGVKDGLGEYGVSHGICPKCVKKRYGIAEKFKED